MKLETIVGETMKKERRIKGYEQVVFISDVHIPYHDKKTAVVLNEFLKVQQPEILILGGDIMDMYSVSQYSKHPSRTSKLQKEVEQTEKYIATIRSILPNTRMIYLEGNHEDRMRRYLMKNPEISGLKALEIPQLLNLDKYDIEYRMDYTHKGFLFKHGNVGSMHSAKGELNAEGTSGMSGHLHKPQVFMDKTRHGERKWITVGHLSDESKAEYLARGGTSNWVEGFGIVNFYYKEKMWVAQQIDIIKNKFVYDGIIYK